MTLVRELSHLPTTLNSERKRLSTVLVRATECLAEFRRLEVRLRANDLPRPITLSLAEFAARGNVVGAEALAAWLEGEADNLGALEDSNEPLRASIECVYDRALSRLRAFGGPSLPWLLSLHRELAVRKMVNRALPADARRQGQTREPGSWRPPQPDALSALDLALSCRREMEPLAWLATAIGVLRVTQPFQAGAVLLECLTTTLLLEWLGFGYVPLWTQYVARAVEPKTDIAQVERLTEERDFGVWTVHFLEQIVSSVLGHERAHLTLTGIHRKELERVLLLDTATLPVFRLHALLARLPVVSCATVTRFLKVTKPTANRSLSTLALAEVLFETTGKQRDRVYVRKSAIDVLSASVLDDGGHSSTEVEVPNDRRRISACDC